MAFVEREKKLPKGVEIRPEGVAIPEDIEKKEGVQPRPTQFTAQVRDDQGHPLFQTPQTKTVSIQLPSDQTTLASWAKGPVVDSLTWLGKFWLRIVKKATHFGWRLVKKT
jgi:hypothetical protein